MFTNANVLFRTRFVDGVSMVTRYTQTQKKALTEKNQTETTSEVKVTEKTRKTSTNDDKRKRVKS